MARDRIHVQRWRREARLEPHLASGAGQEGTQVLGHGPDQGCDFCDNLRLERADGLKEEEEEGGEEEWERTPLDDLDTIAETTETLFDEKEGERVSMDDSQTLRATQEERIIDRYLKSSSSFSSSIYPPSSHQQKRQSHQGGQVRYSRRRDEEEKKESASQWARSYTRLVDAL